jgi:hypothetical protein
MPRQKKDSWSEDIEAALALPEGSEQELYAQAGRAVIRLSDIEKVLAFFCVILYRPMDFDATKRFYSCRNFEARLSHVDSLVENVDIAEISKRWKPISKVVRSHLETRNLIAHQGMARSSGVNEHGDHYYYLWPPLFREGGRPLTVTVVKTTADAFEKAYENLRELVSFTNRYGH